VPDTPIAATAVSLQQLIRRAPKVELHLHIEGTLEPELLVTLADRHRVVLPFATIEQVRAAYRFTNLQSFLNIYYQAAAVLRQAEDFEQLTWAYLTRMAAENVRHVEIFFDPQTHTARGAQFNEVVDGIASALHRAERELNITGGLIACLLRDLGPLAAESTLESILARPESIIGLGLDSSERNFPPEPFERLFDRARAEGLRTVAHAGEEGPPAYIWGALDTLKVERIDHGIRALEDPRLVQRLAESKVPLTVCPLSNVALRVVDTLEHHPLDRLLHAGVVATVNSDDPAYFGGYLSENLVQVTSALGLRAAEVLSLLRNSIAASFASEARRAVLRDELGRDTRIQWFCRCGAGRSLATFDTSSLVSAHKLAISRDTAVRQACGRGPSGHRLLQRAAV
jgi:adenine deaminase